MCTQIQNGHGKNIATKKKRVYCEHFLHSIETKQTIQYVALHPF